MINPKDVELIEYENENFNDIINELNNGIDSNHDEDCSLINDITNLA